MPGFKTGIVTMAVSAAVAAGLASWAAEKTVTLDPRTSKVTFTLDATAHVVEGVLALRSGEVRFDPATGDASGEIVIELAGATTGNDRRDRKMHTEVLETPEFPVASFRLRRVAGPFVEDGVSQLVLEGTLRFHGADRPLEIPARVTAGGGRVAADLEFPIPFVAWGLKDPSVLFLRVAKEVTVRVVAEGTVRDPADATR